MNKIIFPLIILVLLGLLYAVTVRDVQDGANELPSAYKDRGGLEPEGEASTQVDLSSHREPRAVVRLQTWMGGQGLPPMPSHEQPLQAQLPSLLERAEAGDPVATCRLATAVEYCVHHAQHQSFTNRVLRSLETGEGSLDDLADLLIDPIGLHEEFIDGLPPICEGLDFSGIPDIGRLFERNYHALSPRQKAILVLSNTNGQLRRLKSPGSFSQSAMYLMPDYLADHSVEMLMEGYRTRDTLALEGLVLLHAPASLLSPQGVAVWKPHQRKFLKYSWIMRDLFGLEALGQNTINIMRLVAAGLPREVFDSIGKDVEREVMAWRSHELNSSQALQRPDDIRRTFHSFKCE